MGDWRNQKERGFSQSKNPIWNMAKEGGIIMMTFQRARSSNGVKQLATRDSRLATRRGHEKRNGTFLVCPDAVEPLPDQRISHPRHHRRRDIIFLVRSPSWKHSSWK